MDNTLRQQEKNLSIDQKEIQLREQLVNNISIFDNIVSKSYLAKLDQMPIVPYEGNGQAIRWYRITKIVYERGVFFADKMAMLYTALHDECSMVALALRKEQNGKIELFLGTRDPKGSLFVSGDLLEYGIRGILPGVEMEDMSDTDMFTSFKDESDIAVSCVSGIGSLIDEKKEHFIQGVENLINTVNNTPVFTALIIADSISYNGAVQIQHAYEQLFKSISPLAQIHLSFNETDTDGVTNTLAEGFNESVSQNISNALSFGESSSEGSGKSSASSFGFNVGVSAFGANYSSTNSEFTNHSDGKNSSITLQEGSSIQAGTHTDLTVSVNVSKTIGRTMQITSTDRTVKNCLELIDKNLERIKKSKPMGLWAVATYFISNDNTNCKKLAGVYRGSIMGGNSEVESVSINHWPIGSGKTSLLLPYLRYQLHPHFSLNDGDIDCTAASLVNSRELAIHLSLPQSSVPGILVRNEQTFGRDVRTNEKLTEKNSLSIGSITHLGVNYPNERVRLSIDGLSKHVLITGTTGSGKSNTLYLLLSELVKKDKGFLVIEPAKGEYKEIFGLNPDIEGVKVFGTNSRKTKLLRINPFEFPGDVELLEHIDSLLEIFNACWPMYAAMPQVLKHSIIEAYKSCGWSLEKSFSPLGIYPTVEDVLEALRTYINSSEYSSDTKGDYKGALETRLKSLCEGVTGRMLSGIPVADEELFNGRVIVDLSRVKSMETKSLLMGLLIMKLDEFRSSEHKGMNLKLRHVTVLEEAHHLLKRSSTTQSMESSNIAGMAVEKIATSMAEMRTYGEGFIIADQSPSLLDQASIRNTNTKIIMTLPEKEDRMSAGKSAALTDEQTSELARLKIGEAIVYQNGWEEAVKVQIDHYKRDSEYTWKYTMEQDEADHERNVMRILSDLLYHHYVFGESQYSSEDFAALVMSTNLCGSKKVRLLDIGLSTEKFDAADCALIISVIIGQELLTQVQSESDIDNMNRHLAQEIGMKFHMDNNWQDIDTFVNMYMLGCSMTAPKPFYEEWQERTLKSMML